MVARENRSTDGDTVESIKMGEVLAKGTSACEAFSIIISRKAGDWLRVVGWMKNT